MRTLEGRVSVIEDWRLIAEFIQPVVRQYDHPQNASFALRSAAILYFPFFKTHLITLSEYKSNKILINHIFPSFSLEPKAQISLSISSQDSRKMRNKRVAARKFWYRSSFRV
jgi:hypothetical protein